MYHVETVGNERSSTFPYAVVSERGIVNRYTHRHAAEVGAEAYTATKRDPFALRVRYLRHQVALIAWQMQRVDEAGYIGPQAKAGATETLRQWVDDMAEAHGGFLTANLYQLAYRRYASR